MYSDIKNTTFRYSDPIFIASESILHILCTREHTIRKQVSTELWWKVLSTTGVLLAHVALTQDNDVVGRQKKT